MHILESTMGETVFNNVLNEMYNEARENYQGKLSSNHLYKKFKKVISKTHARDFFENWVWSTSCPELELSYTFVKKNNSIEITLT